MESFYSEEELTQLNLQHPQGLLSERPFSGENQLGTGSLLPSAGIKFFYDFAKFGADIGDYLADNEESTLDDWWTVEEKLTGFD